MWSTVVLIDNKPGDLYIAFFLRHLNDKRLDIVLLTMNYLQLYQGIKYFWYFIKGRQFYALTNHKPLIFASQSHSDKNTPRQLRHVYFISQFTCDIQHISGTDNCVADALKSLHKSPPSIDFKAMAATHWADPDNILTSITTTSITNIMQILYYCMVCLQEFLDFTYHNNFNRQCLIPCTHSHTQVFVPLNTSSHHSMSGLISTKMYVSGLDVVYNVRNLRLSVKLQYHLANLKCLMSDLPIYTLTLLAPFHLPDDVYLLTCID